MARLRLVLLAIGVVAVVALAVVPTTKVFKTGYDSSATFDCGAPATHAFGGANVDEAPVMIFPGYVRPARTCREQSRLRLGLAGGVAVVTLAGAFLTLRERRSEAASVTV